MRGERLPVTYILPIRGDGPQGLSELTRYLRWLDERVDLLVIDGSDTGRFLQHACAWAGIVLVAPARELRCQNGKAWGVLTGLQRACEERVVIADDDVRYDDDNLRKVVTLLDTAEIVRPQNYFWPLPWHARWDTGRSLLNRITGGDWPGTLALRAPALGPTRRYDGNCLFENLELVRTVKARRGRELVASDVFVLRLPPTARKFVSQRVRQAYDEFARPRRMAVQLALLPSMLMFGWRRPLLLAAAYAGVACLAELGRRRNGGTRVFPVSASFLAPLWLSERGICAWLAVGARFFLGGIRYGDRTLQKAASPERELAASNASRSKGAAL